MTVVSKFLSKGKDVGQIVVIDGYAVNIELDGSMVLMEPSDLPDGYYTFDGEPVDSSLSDFLDSVLDQEIVLSKATLEQYLKYIVLNASSEEVYRTVTDAPNITKGMADNLEKANEALTFAMVGKDIEFVCFGTRPIIQSFLEKTCSAYVSVSPLNYYYATNYKGKPAFYMMKNSLLVRGDGGNIAILLDIDLKSLSEYRVGNNGV